ncbi:MAG: 4-alpha-glucanotransferase [Candidatus Margulisiibacteriota bacterium]
MITHPRILQPTFSIATLRSRECRDFGVGNMTTFKKAVLQLRRMGIKAVCLLPLNETLPNTASFFDRTSNNALSIRLVDPEEIPEIKETELLSRQLDHDLGLAMAANGSARINNAMAEVELGRYFGLAYERFCERTRAVTSLGAEKAARDGSLGSAGERISSFKAFCTEHSWWLDMYAYFKAAEEHYGGRPVEEWDQQYLDMESELAQRFLGDNEGRVNYFKFVQMEIYRQVGEGFAYAHENGIEEIEGLLGVGVSRQSAEAALMPQCYDRMRQIGCFPEPENGYPLQLWEFAAERNTPEMHAFTARSCEGMHGLGMDRICFDHAVGKAGGYTTFPVYDPKLLKTGKYRVLNPEDPADAKLAEDGGQWDIPIGEEARRLAFARDMLAKIIALCPGLKLTFETVGDMNRRRAVEQAISEAIADGNDFTLMRAIPWEDTPFNEYGKSDMAAWTHDIPPVTAFLTGQAGHLPYPWITGNTTARLLERLGILAPQLTDWIDWGRANVVAGLLQRASENGLPYIRQIVNPELDFMSKIDAGEEEKLAETLEYLRKLGQKYSDFIPALEILSRAKVMADGGTPGDVDLSQLGGVAERLRQLGRMPQAHNLSMQLSDLSAAFMQEIYRRLAQGTDAGTVVLPLVGLFTLDEGHLRRAGINQCMNVPGTSGENGNPIGSWELRLPPIEELESLETQIRPLASRASRPFGEAVQLQPTDRSLEGVFYAQLKTVAAESVAYQAANGQWTVWKEPVGIHPLMEIAVAYNGPMVTDGHENKAWAHYDMSRFGFEANRSYVFYDLITELERTLTGEELISHGLRVGLNTANARHHFVIYEKPTLPSSAPSSSGPE